MGQEGFTPLPFPPGFYTADTTVGKETFCWICLVPVVLASSTFHLWASKCPQSWLQGYCHELNYPVQVSFHVSPALLFTYFTLRLFLLCASPRDLQTFNWARPKAGKVTSFPGDVPLHPWSPNPQPTEDIFAGRGEHIQMLHSFPWTISNIQKAITWIKAEVGENIIIIKRAIWEISKFLRRKKKKKGKR